ncbi:transglycosylase family protein [Kitasatospora sp. MBT63]|uniref:transglycosylase family protein n=1 Tax=Kitasatospora sp. MBT63 TaxID=1444768 RepID=UPI000539BABC|nr:transglycosylase family protein [Kitasatospora sp. MBT63]
MSDRPTPTLARTAAALALSTAVTLAAAILPLGDASAASVRTWDKVADCESGGDWTTVSSGSPTYYGGLQFSAATWSAYGGTRFAPQANLATKQQQILIAEEVLRGQGESAWPVCGPRAGLGDDHAAPYPDAPPPMAPGMSPIVGVGDINSTGVADFLARDASTGHLYSYMGKGDGTFTGRTDLGGGWSQYDMIVGVDDINRTGVPDLLARDPSTGHLYSYMGKGDGTFTGRTDLGGGWNQYDLLIGAGDLNNTGVPDLLARDRNGDLWVYMGIGNGTFTGRTRIGGGWDQYDTIVGVGDINRTGVPDLLARDPSTGHLYSYMGRGDGTFTGRTDLGGGWNQYDALTGPGDINNTGVADLLARDRSTGHLYSYMGRGDGTFTGRTDIGYGYDIYA